MSDKTVHAGIMKNFTELHLKKESLDAYSLPDIGYPVPVSQFDSLSQIGGKIDLKALLFWLQEYSALHSDKWINLETAIFRLALLLAPEDRRRRIRVYGDNWFLICSAIDLNQTIITIQRQDHLIAAMSPLGNGQLCVCSYRPLDAKSARYLINLSINPSSDNQKGRWESAIERLVGEENNRADERGEAYLMFWEFGLGVNSDNNCVAPWFDWRESAAIPNNLSATQLGVCYEYSPESVFQRPHRM